MALLLILITIFILFLFIYLNRTQKTFEYFNRKRIPGPPAKLFFGHSLTLWSAPSTIQLIQEWSKKYGNIYGFYEGSKPVYVTSDVDILQEIYIKQFSSFHSRRNNFLSKSFENFGAHLFSANADEWRRQRHVINPTFTALKLKTMMPLVQKCIESMINRLDKIGSEQFNIYEVYRRLTMDVIWHCAFGVDTDMQNDLNNIYLKKSLDCFKVDTEKLWAVRVTKLFPFLEPIFRWLAKTMITVTIRIQKIFPSFLTKLNGFSSVWIITHVDDLIRKRLTSGTRRTDLLQLMIDAVTENEQKELSKTDSTSKILTYKEVVMNIFLFMLAGFETTSTFLAYSTAVLVQHPDIQEKLQKELDENFSEPSEIFDYDKIAQLSYMDLFIREVLRMYRISGQPTTRECNNTTLVCGHEIEKGSIILTDVHAVHYSSELWGPDDPNLFIPERHLVKRHPVAYMPFGIGPRNCVGLRLALLEMKISLGRILLSYNITAGNRFTEGMTRQEAFIITPNAINIRLSKRNL